MKLLRAIALPGAIFLLALAFRIGSTIDYEDHHPWADRPVIDEASYERWALEIAGGEWVGDEVFFQEPLYPYWLGAFYATWDYEEEEGPQRALEIRRTALRHTQAFFGAVTAVLVFLVTRRVFGRGAAIAAGVGIALYRPLIHLPALLLKPNLFLPLLLVLVWLLLRASIRTRGLGWWLGAGAVAGLGALLRGNMLLLLPLLALLPFLRARRAGLALAAGLGPAVAFVLGTAFVLLPVAARNQTVGGVFVLTTSGAGTNLYGGNNAQNPYGIATEFDWVRGIPEHEAADWRHEAERRAGRALDPAEVSSFWMGATLRSLRDDPLLHLSILWNKLRLSLGRYEVPDNHHLEWDAQHLHLLALPIPGYGLWGWLGLAGLLAYLGRRVLGAPAPDDPAAAAELAGLYALYLATIVLTVTSMRIRLALVPLLMPFAGWLVAIAVASLRERKGVASWLAPLFVAAPAVFVPVFDADTRAKDFAERDFNNAIYLLERGDFETARAVVDELERERPDKIATQLLMAEIEYHEARILQDLDGQYASLYQAAMTRVLRIIDSPNADAKMRFRAHGRAGWIRLNLGAWHEAEHHFREALRFDPADFELRLALANSIHEQAVDLPPGDERGGRLREVLVLLEDLSAEEPSDELGRLLDQVRGEL